LVAAVAQRRRDVRARRRLSREREDSRHNTFFTIVVMMAVVTTGMASPLYDVLSRGLVLEGARPLEALPP